MFSVPELRALGTLHQFYARGSIKVGSLRLGSVPGISPITLGQISDSTRYQFLTLALTLGT